MINANEIVPVTPIEFTERETQVIPLLSVGKSTKQIALQLGISTRSVEVHLTHIYEKLGVCCRTEAVLKLMRLSDKS